MKSWDDYVEAIGELPPEAQRRARQILDYEIKLQRMKQERAALRGRFTLITGGKQE